jgi:site-specific DNA-methyltransferase (adenine-specific)
MKPYLTTRHGVLFCDDCLNVLRSLRSESVDCIFADPPFNLGKDYRNAFKDNGKENEYLEWCKQWMNECGRTLKQVA